MQAWSGGRKYFALTRKPPFLLPARQEYPNGGGQQGGGRTIRAERKPAHVQVRGSCHLSKSGKTFIPYIPLNRGEERRGK
eukprot:1143818-Pelagomonas_calceolata.AAC.2